MTTAVIVLAAGAGTRMRSARSKLLHAVGGRTLLEHSLLAARSLDPARLVVVVGNDREQVVAHLQTLDPAAVVAVQEQQHGTGHAVAVGLEALAADLAGGTDTVDTGDRADTVDTVVVTYGDVPLLSPPTLAALVAAHHRAGSAITALTTVVADPTGYGRIVRDQFGAMVGVVEHRDADPIQLAITEINAGVYAFDAALLGPLLATVGSANDQGEIYLTDTVAAAVRAGHPVGAVLTDDPWEVEGINDRVQLAALGAELNRRVVTAWMRAGVTVIDPASTWIDVGVRLARDVTLYPGVQLHGTTTAGEGAAIGPDTTLTDVEVGAGATVVRTQGSASVIGAGSSVGPFAYLRPGTNLGEHAKIGTFVESKNATIGDNSKVPHLTYVGDATIGTGTNIGASSVFVNYDGVTKHHTRIGDHCRTGSDTKFVAPVTVGDGAYTGAGTVVRRNIPAGALAVSGGPQRNLEGWVRRSRPATAAAAAAAAADDAAAALTESAEGPTVTTGTAAHPAATAEHPTGTDEHPTVTAQYPAATAEHLTTTAETLAATAEAAAEATATKVVEG